MVIKEFYTMSFDRTRLLIFLPEKKYFIADDVEIPALDKSTQGHKM